MLQSALLLPTEQPPTILELKKALLSYESIYLPSHEDRELIPPINFMQVSSGLPFGVGAGHVRLLGKIRNYDKKFEHFLTISSFLFKTEKLKLLKAPVYNSGMGFGFFMPPKGLPHPGWIYENYRYIAAQEEYLSLISGDKLKKLIQEPAEIIAPPNMMDGAKKDKLPDLALVKKPYVSKDKEELASNICYSRLGALVKNLGICGLMGLQPYTSDVGFANVIDKFNSNYIAGLSTSELDDEILTRLNYLGRLHNILMQEFIDIHKLDSMSLEEIVRLRTKAWEKSLASKNVIFDRLREVALENPSSENFDKSCKSMIKDYVKAQKDWANERTNLIIVGFGEILKMIPYISVNCTLARPEFSMLMANLSNPHIIQCLLTMANWAALLKAAHFTGTMIKDHGPKVNNLMKSYSDLKSSSGYAFTAPYKYLRA